MSPSVSRPSQPISAHCPAVSGAVAIIEEFIGSQVRSCPLRFAVNPCRRALSSTDSVVYGPLEAGNPKDSGRGRA